MKFLVPRVRPIVSAIALGAVFLVAAGFGIVHSTPQTVAINGAASLAIPAADSNLVTGVGAAAAGAAGSGNLTDLITRLQGHLEQVPADQVSWATLGLAYVQQARITIDPSYYPRAEGALERSLSIDADGNYLALAGLSALASGRHDFTSAAQFASDGLAINPYSSLLFGALSDAQIQLGDYDAGYRSVQQMIDLSPDTSSLARASYAWELRGDVDQARALMQRALDDAPTPADRSFALFQLGELDFNAGQPESALEHYLAALSAAPQSTSALAGKAKAEAALGQVLTALDDYATVVARAPDPAYLIEYGDLLTAQGRTDEAAAQYDIVGVTRQLFASNGVLADPMFALFEADHGDVADALATTEAGLTANPFLTMLDARAWALHRAGRDAEALEVMDAALDSGYRSARFHFHAGMISAALGNTGRAIDELTKALSINPYFHPLESIEAQTTLDQLRATS